jgi:probable F420-dependent oxidoreductase
MTEVAGEVCDGILLHGFTTERYVREVTLPALERGWEAGGKTRDRFEVTGPMFVVTGSTEEEMAAARTGTKRQIGFYGSTPAYRGVLELHGWGDMQTELNRLSKQGEWEAMGDVITDDVLETFAVVGEPSEIPKLMLARYGDVIDRISLYAPYQTNADQWAQVLAGFHAG